VFPAAGLCAWWFVQPNFDPVWIESGPNAPSQQGLLHEARVGPGMSRCLLGFGANLGDRCKTLECSVNVLRGVENVKVVAVSRWHRSQPVGGPAGQGEFLNGAVVVETTLNPHALLLVAGQIEDRFGRKRGVRWAARTLDIDLLLYDEQIIRLPDLEIPHPRMHLRQFVLGPATEVVADWIHPQFNKTVAQLCQQLDLTGPTAIE
jgi:2-amino-4-hydroxy-6-hydroxymethyldihydropteridine diphosphokinase